MSSEADLLREILAHPADDEPRRKYGELLEQRGDPRGELIRIQLRLHRAMVQQEYWDLPDGSELRARETALIREHGAEWAREVTPLVDDYSFERGFVDWVRIDDAAAFLDRADAIYAVAPVVLLSLRRVGAVADRLFASPHLQRIRALELISAGLSDSSMKALAASPSLGELRWLDVGGNNITAAGMEALFASPNLPKLAYLSARGNDFNDGEEIADTPGMIDGGIIFDWGGSRLGYDLEKKYGEKPFLHYRTRDERYRSRFMSTAVI